MDDPELCRSLPIRKSYTLRDLTVLPFTLLLCNLTKLRNFCADLHRSLKIQNANPYLSFKYEISREFMMVLNLDALDTMKGYDPPSEVADKIIGAIRPLYEVVYQFLHINPILLNTTIDLRKIILLSNDGSINHCATQRKIMMNPNLDNKTRFASACALCSEKDISLIWNNMSESEKEFYKASGDDYNVYTPPLVKFWRDFLIYGSLVWPLRDDFFQYAPYFEGAYFLINKLPLAKRQQKIAKCFEYALHHRIDLDSWLRIMDLRQKTEMIQTNAMAILRSYLEWPRVLCLIDVANVLWRYIDPQEFVEFLFRIYDRIISENSHYDYLKVAVQLINSCPDEYGDDWDVNSELETLSFNLKEIIRKRSL